MAKVNKVGKVNLELLETLMTALKSSLEAAELLDDNQYYVELSRAQGLASGISQEAVGIITDIANLIRYSQGQNQEASSETSGLMDKLFAGMKDGGRKTN